MEHDDLEKARFKQKTHKDSVEQDNILMKYFGSELSEEEEFEEEPQQASTFRHFVKAGVSSLIIVVLSVAANSEIAWKFLSFTGNSLIRKATLYFILFVAILTVLLIGNTI